MRTLLLGPGEFGDATLRWMDGGETLPVPPSPAPPGPPSTPDHLAVRDLLGVGGMGEVWRTQDKQLNRVVALKTVRADLRSPHFAALLELEALVTASLRHPGIPEVYERGTLGDGRPYYTMPVYVGRTLRDLLAENIGRARTIESLRALVDVALRAAEAVAKAHALGILHRDLKPENVYLGEHDEVVVLDWGIARAPVAAAGTAPAEGDKTGVAGTRGYMSPEQEAGDRPRIGPPADVWALGIILDELLHAGRPGPLEDSTARGALGVVVARAIARSPTDRHRDAGDLAEALRGWRSAVDRRARALHLVDRADAEARAAEHERARATHARKEAAALAATIQPWQPEADKRPVWDAEDRAAALAHAAELHMLERDRLLQGAFTHDPELPEAHARLAALYRDRHAEAEAEKDTAAAARCWVLLRAHDRGEHAAYLTGHGTISVHTEPAGAWATLYRYTERDRRLVPVLERELGTTPIVRARVPHGSWLVRLHLDGHAPVDHPLWVRRMEHSDGVPPGDSEPRRIRLPTLGSVGPDDCVVTPGWTLIGGDPGSPAQAPRQRIWLEGFVMRRFPVTNREYLAFLNELAERGQADEALGWAPREKGPSYDQPGRVLYGWDGARFSLVPDREGHTWDPEWPVMMITWSAALAYAAWRAAREGLPWRVAREDEWERAARGADGRFFPWGDHLDATRACYLASWPPGTDILPVPISTFPLDESPFGARGLAGSMRELCHNVWGTPSEHMHGFPALRGGGWNTAHQIVRAATRTITNPRDPNASVGFRLVR
ncbi:MAG: bifunctional serine/threonine-protein kinase/formylglycine-generating enzyme family protein [Pseudomonadota bacterium]|nr:bifunctional serine/threonine-protein kinase/formylglycine-generating enzyme family protein [Pseudomonadota bacterium]